MAMNKKFILHGKYTVLNLPVLLLLAGYGISEIKYRKQIIIYLVALNILYLAFIPFSAPHKGRSRAYPLIREVLNEFKLTSQDRIIINHGSRYVKDYFPKYTSIILPIDLEYLYFYRDREMLGNIFDPAFIEGVNKQNAREKLKNFISSKEPPEKFENYFKKEFIDKMPEGARLAVYINRMTGRFKEEELEQITASEKLYSEKSLARMLISKTSNDIIRICRKNLTLIELQKSQGKEIYLFKKNMD
jgi:hypothetical protein